MLRVLSITGAILAAAGVILAAFPVVAQHEPDAKNWPEIKCANYRSAWNFTLARRSRQGLSAEFIERHEAFIASGCTTQADVCPRSPQEFELANIMVIRAMNSGMASTFLPFACRK